jgi:hypothetical protein
MDQTLLKVKTLQKFIQKHGEDIFISQTISKMLNYKIREYERKIKKLDKDIKRFERTYKKNSSVFFKEFRAGTAGDDMAFVEWASFYQMRNLLLDKKAELEGKRKDG